MLYHYTSSAGMLGIIESRSLWASNPLYLNDAQELVFAAELIRSLIGADGKPMPETNTRLAAIPIGRRQLLRQALDTRYPSSGEVTDLHEETAYVTSFTTTSDSLDMWRGYGPGGGFSLGFDRTILESAFAIDDSEKAFESFQLTCGEAKDLVLAHVGLEVQFLDITYGADEIVSLLLEESGKEHSIFDGDFLVPFLASVKHQAFASEHEVRLVARATGDLSPSMLLRGGPTNLVPYVRLQFPFEALKSITVGPGPYADRSLAALKARFADGGRGEWFHVDLKISEVPYIP